MISVVIPSFNNARYIERCISSVLNQSYKNLEIIIIDDNSADETAFVLKKYENDERVRIILRDYTDSIGKARNDAVSFSNGEFIAFLDSDDYWDPDKLTKQMFFTEKYDIICTNAFAVNSENNIIKHKYLSGLNLSEEITFENEIIENIIITSSVLIKRSLITEDNKFPVVRGFVAEDYYLWLKLMSKGCSCYFLNENLVYYRIHKNKFALNYSYNEIEFLLKSNEYRSEYLNKGYGNEIDVAIKKGTAKCYRVIGINFFKLDKKIPSSKYFIKHIKSLKYISSFDLLDSFKYLVKIILRRRRIRN